MITRIARQTKTGITVARAVEVGFDSDNGDCEWYTICETHNQMTGHPTRKLADSHSADPCGWCEPCRDKCANEISSKVGI